MTSKRDKKYTDILEHGIDLITFYKENPCIAAYELLGVDLAPIQRVVFRDMWFKDYVIVVATRGFGKTYLLSLLATLSSLLNPGYRVGLVSNSFRQSKFIFSEIEKLYSSSSILRDACEKPPIRGTDSCYLKFKSVKETIPSYIEALPLGNDGGKIRGSRFYLIVGDELAQIPKEIIDAVIMPMAATSAAPMERVRRLEHKETLLKLGLATQDDFEKETVNKMVMTSSGYFKFNHMWGRMCDYWSQMDVGAREGLDVRHAVWQVPYWDLPAGFLDDNSIQEARRNMPNSVFRMEYEAAMVSDSEGFFKASILDMCTRNSGHSIELSGDSGSQYILGVDPNQGGKASTGMVLIRLGQVNRVVLALELKNNTTQQLTKAIQELCNNFNIIRIFMDKGGGGKAILDLLEEGYDNKTPIIDRTNPDHKNLQGSHILEMINFNPSWISDANFIAKAMLEDKKLLFPEPSVDSILDIVSVNYDTINNLKSQMLSIIVSQTPTGMLHFDTPTKGQNKDIYSAFILAAYGVRIVEKELEVDDTPIIHGLGGLIRPRNAPGAGFNFLGATGTASSAAVLKKKNK